MLLAGEFMKYSYKEVSNSSQVIGTLSFPDCPNSSKLISASLGSQPSAFISSTERTLVQIDA